MVALAREALADQPDFFRGILQAILQRSLETEIAVHLKVDPHEHLDVIEGVSTCKVKDVTEVLCGTSFSKSTVSRLAGQLEADLAAWRERRLVDVVFPYLVVDARYGHVRVDGRVVSQGVLIVKGVREVGQRELLAVDVADSESEATYDALFRSFKERGRQGVQLATSDDHEGLVAAIQRHFQGASWQRCQVHFLRNARG